MKKLFIVIFTLIIINVFAEEKIENKSVSLSGKIYYIFNNQVRYMKNNIVKLYFNDKIIYDKAIKNGLDVEKDKLNYKYDYYITIISDESGNYKINNLPLGKYFLNITFKTPEGTTTGWMFHIIINNYGEYYLNLTNKNKIRAFSLKFRTIEFGRAINNIKNNSIDSSQEANQNDDREQ